MSFAWQVNNLLFMAIYQNNHAGSIFNNVLADINMHTGKTDGDLVSWNKACAAILIVDFNGD